MNAHGRETFCAIASRSDNPVVLSLSGSASRKAGQLLTPFQYFSFEAAAETEAAEYLDYPQPKYYFLPSVVGILAQQYPAPHVRPQRPTANHRYSRSPPSGDR